MIEGKQLRIRPVDPQPQAGPPSAHVASLEVAGQPDALGAPAT